MDKSTFFKHIDTIEKMSFVLSKDILLLYIELVANSFELKSTVFEKIKFYVFDCSLGKYPKEYYVHNGRDKFLLNSKTKLWEFIHE